MEKTLIEEIRLGEHDFYLDEIEEVFNDEGIELRDFELCNRETQHRIETNIKLTLEKAVNNELKQEQVNNKLRQEQHEEEKLIEEILELERKRLMGCSKIQLQEIKQDFDNFKSNAWVDKNIQCDERNN